MQQRAAAPANLLLPWWRRRGQWSTEGQCEGMTRLLTRCKVHMSSTHADAEPLRRGERFYAHHNPKRFTGVRCAGMRKKSYRGRCGVWSGMSHKDAVPLRCGSPYCHHHRVKCHGMTRANKRCTVTSSSEHAHAKPLREGSKYCAHHSDVRRGGAAACDKLCM